MTIATIEHIFEEGAACRKKNGLGVRLNHASAMTAGGGNLQVLAQGDPGFARPDATGQRIIDGPVQLGEPVVAREDPGVHLAELFRHRATEFAELHLLLARHELAAIAGNEIGRNRVGDTVAQLGTQALDERETSAHLAHNHRKRSIERVGNRGEDLARSFLLATLYFAEVAERYARLTCDLPKGTTLLQAEVTQHIANLLTH